MAGLKRVCANKALRALSDLVRECLDSCDTMNSAIVFDRGVSKRTVRVTCSSAVAVL